MKTSIALPLAAAIFATACNPTRTVTLGWDVPKETPQGYRIFVDDTMVRDIPPPPVDAACNCYKVSVPVPRGHHTVRVVAYNAGGESPPSASITVD